MREGCQRVVAQLISLGDSRSSCNIYEGQKQVLVGRHAQCDIAVNDMYVSLYHFSVSCPASADGRCVVEQLGDGSCIVNDGILKKGRRKELRHDDRVSILVYSDSGDIKRRPFVAFRFVQEGLSNETAVRASEPGAGSIGSCILSLAEPGVCHRVDPENLQVAVARHPSCKVFDEGDELTNMRAHLKFHHKFPRGCTLKQISTEGCFLNEMFVGPDAEHELQHGDIITICKYAARFRSLPVFVYIDPHSEKAQQTTDDGVHRLPTPCRRRSPSRAEPSIVEVHASEEVDPDALTMTLQETLRWMPSVSESLDEEVVDVPDSSEQSSSPPSVQAETLPMPGPGSAAVQNDDARVLASRPDPEARRPPCHWQRPLQRRRLSLVRETLDVGITDPDAADEETSGVWRLLPAGSQAMTLGDSLQV